ncbi:MAG TPA: thiamine pyrophosphate-dependent enzyme, partial [Polyangiaceae bacterium]
MFEEFGINQGFVEDLHSRWQQSPQSVDEKWRQFFDGLNGSSSAGTNGTTTNGDANGSANGNGAYVNGTTAIAAATNGAGRKEAMLAAAAIQGRVYQLLNAYRVRGHLFAHLDPLALPSDGPPQELNLSNFGLSVSDLDTTFPTVGIAGLPERATLRSIIAHLSETYCRSIGVEFTQIEEPDAREWIQERMESTRNRAELGRDQVLRILSKLTDAETFEAFIAKNYVGAKRFSVEGAESMIALLDLLIDEAGAQGVSEIVLGMAHRGRLNVLANIMGKNVREIFAAFDDKNPERFLGGGDVKYHLGYSSNRETPSGNSVHLSLAFNPSHLEFVNPVVEGRVRAKQDRKKRTNVMPLLIHGDAAFMGQGVVPETLNMAGLEGYSTGGTVHVVVNNQIGFTTVPRDSRSTRYCTDITRMLRCPV